MSDDLVEPRRLKALAGEWTSEELGRFFWLTPDDLLQIRTCRGAANRLGFAPNLLLLRFLHYPVPSLDLAPPRIIQFVAMQLHVHPDVLADYSVRRPQTRDEHLVQIPGYLKLRPYAHEQDDPRLAEYLLGRALQRDDPAVLLEEAEEWLRHEGILYPAESTLQKLIAQARPQAESQLFTHITRHLNAAQAQAVEDLLQRDQGKRGSTLAWLKEPAIQASPASMKTLLTNLETVRQTRVSTVDLSRLNRNRVCMLAHLGEKYHRDSLLRFSPRNAPRCWPATSRISSRNSWIGSSPRSMIWSRASFGAPSGKNRATMPLDRHYTFLRKFLPDLLTALEFTGTSAAKPVLQAIEALKRMDAEGRRRLPPGTLMRFLPADWRKAIEATDGVTAKHLWELGLAEQMRRLLRSSDLSVPGSRQHKVWSSYLHTPAAWAEQKASWFARGMPLQKRKRILMRWKNGIGPP